MGNRPRAGKDYLAGCCGLLYEGRANEDSPLDRDSNETRKRIMAGRVLGAIRMEVDATDKKRIKYRFSPVENTPGERPEGNPSPRPIPVLGTLGTLST